MASRFASTIHRSEDALSIAVLAAMSLLPIVEIIGRRLPTGGIPGSIILVQNLTLVMTFLGAALAAREERLLALATADILPAVIRPVARVVSAAVGVGVTTWLLTASLEVVEAEKRAGEIVALGIPSWMVESVIPLGLGAVALRLILRAGDSWRDRLFAAAGLLVPLFFQTSSSLQGTGLLVPCLIALGAATALGLPLFAAIAGLALLLFWDSGTTIASVAGETSRLTTFPILPAVPLFTLAGYILASGGANQRLVRVFRALFGWMPGGAAIVTSLLFGFFTAFTGASGVTILSLGGLMLPVLVKNRYPEGFSVGLLTVSGSIGLLFPPSLPVILYGVYAVVPVDELFMGGLLPGWLLISLVALLGVRQGLRDDSGRVRFERHEAMAALWEGKWELLTPVVVLLGIFSPFATMVEAASVTVLYAFAVECLYYRDISLSQDMPRIMIESATLIGGFLIILGAALGLTNYLVFQDVPGMALEWIQAHVSSPLLFLLLLNLFLIVVGALMDIYSAIFVVVPIIKPIAAAYGIDPVHLGIIFLSNLELGYLTPPMGENLFLSAYRFGHPVMRVFRFTWPFYLIIACGVLLITYMPWMTLGLVEWYRAW